MNLTQTLDDLFGQAVLAGSVPGVVAMVTDRDATLYEGAFGERAFGQGPAMTVDSVGWIASMTKALTSAAALQLVEQGHLDLEAPAADVLPALGAVEVLEGFDDCDNPITRPPKREVTLRHLLTHTAGFGYEFWSEDVGRVHAALSLPGLLEARDASLDTPLLFDPGERWEYGINIDWAGKMIEAASGKTLGAYLRENLFEPLGMTDTAFSISPSMRDRLAKVHQRVEDGGLIATDLELSPEPEYEAGGGGLYGTMGDYLKFVRMILNEGIGEAGQVLQPETVRQMSCNQIGALRVGSLTSQTPGISNDVELFPGVPKTWSLGFQINEGALPTGRPAGGLMWAGIANSYYWIDPSNGLGGVYMTQVLPFADREALSCYLAFETAVYDSLS